MLQVNWCTFCVLLVLFLTTTESRTENRESISGALSDGTNAFRATADTDDSNMQHVAPGSTDEDDWETTRYRILSSVMDRLSTVRSVEDLLKLGLMDKDEMPLTPQDMSIIDSSTADKLVINGNGEVAVAVAAQCVPREIPMPINVTQLQANTILYPKCINVRRCGGCCNMANIVCRPAETQKVIYHLMKITVDRGDTHASISGLHPLEVIQHSKCRCVCSLSQESCGPLKTFDARYCLCRCKAYVRCSPPHFFNPETCKCECAERSLCCSGAAGCGLAFSNRTCESFQLRCSQKLFSRNANCAVCECHPCLPSRCELQDKLFIASSTNQTQGHTSVDGSRLVGGDKTQLSQTTPRINQTEQVLNPDSCLGHTVCPFNFERKVNSQGRCVCTHRHRHKGRK